MPLYWNRHIVVFLGLFIYGVTNSYAQETDELVTDRPDFTESPVTVPKGQIQVETGLTWEQAANMDFLNGPETLFRWSMVSGFEVRLNLPDYIIEEERSELGNAGFSVKIELGDVAGWDMAAVASIAVPVSLSRLSSGTVDPGLILTTGRDLSPMWSTGAQVSVARQGGGTGVDLASTLVFGVSLHEHVGTFLEIRVSDIGNAPTATVLHHGYTARIGHLMQLDLHGGIGRTEEAPDVFLGAGWSAPEQNG